jgi:uncharacterized protein YggE
MEQLDTIAIEATDSDELFADHADLLVTVQGSSLFTGREALKKAREVRELVEGLKECGLSETDVLLESVYANVSSGITGRSSSADYRLRVRCQEMDALADLLGVITSQRNANLTRVVWKYSDLEEFRFRLLERCLSKLKRKAEMVASSLGVELLGVHEFQEQRFAPRAMLAQGDAFDLPSDARAKAMKREDLGLSVSHSRQVTVVLSTMYRVGPLKRVGEEKKKVPSLESVRASNEA